MNMFRRKRTPQQIGVETEQLLRNELYSASFDAVEKAILDALLDAPAESEKDKERIVLLTMRLQSLVGTKKWLDNQIQFGKLAENLSNKQEVSKLRKK